MEMIETGTMAARKPKRVRYSRLISNAFHPLLIPLYSLLQFYSISLMYREPSVLLVKGVVCTIVFSVLCPLVGLIRLHAKGIISGIDLPHREDRVIPYLMCAGFMFVNSLLLCRMGMFGFIYGSFYAGALSIILCALVNFWWKVSIHSAAMGCWLGCVLRVWTAFPLCYYAQNSQIVVTAVILLAGGVLSARIASGHHSQAQVYAGFALGLLVGFNLLSLFWA